MDTKEFLNKHKKTIFIVSGTAAFIALGAALYYYRQPIQSFCQKLIRVKTPMQPITKTTAITEKISIQPKQITQLPLDVKSPCRVKGHFRILPDGWHASPEKIAEARKANIILMNGQTWVKSYTKGGVVA